MSETEGDTTTPEVTSESPLDELSNKYTEIQSRLTEIDGRLKTLETESALTPVNEVPVEAEGGSRKKRAARRKTSKAQRKRRHAKQRKTITKRR